MVLIIHLIITYFSNLYHERVQEIGQSKCLVEMGVRTGGQDINKHL